MGGPSHRHGACHGLSHGRKSTGWFVTGCHGAGWFVTGAGTVGTRPCAAVRGCVRQRGLQHLCGADDLSAESTGHLPRQSGDEASCADATCWRVPHRITVSSVHAQVKCLCVRVRVCRFARSLATFSLSLFMLVRLCCMRVWMCVWMCSQGDTIAHHAVSRRGCDHVRFYGPC